MTRPERIRAPRVAEPAAVFVTAEEGAARCMVSADTWQVWRREGFIPPPAIDRGQTLRWHWPSVEKSLAARTATLQGDDPYMRGVNGLNLEARGTKIRRRQREIAA